MYTNLGLYWETQEQGGHSGYLPYMAIGKISETDSQLGTEVQF